MEEFLQTDLKDIEVDAPDFEHARMVYDWRNYVPEEFKAEWDKFTLREKQIIAKLCKDRAMAEEWFE